MGKTFNDIERDIDATLHSLPIFRLPLNVALIDCLTIYESQMLEASDIRQLFSHDVAIVNIKRSIETLIPKLYERCLKPTSVKYKPNTARALNTARQALVFCSRYHSFEHSFTLHHYGWYQGSIDNYIISFTYPPDLDFGLGQLNKRLNLYRQERSIRQAEETGRYPPSVPRETVLRKLREVVKSGSKYILHAVPQEMYDAYKQIAEAIFPVPTIDRATRIGSYTLGEYYNFWLEFATLMLAQYSFSMERSIQGNFNQAVTDSILLFTVEELATLINHRLGLTSDTVKDMICEMILNLNVKRPDILIQPLLPLPPDKLIIAPSLIYTANWELCLLRNWNQRYPDIYSHTIAQKKHSLADEMGKLFNPNRFIVETNRKLKNEQGADIGDVDVAVFDPHDGGLALFEVKWILDVDSARESKKAEEQIVKGIEQIKSNKARLESNPQTFLNRVFIQRRVDVSDIKYIKIAVVGRGDIGGHETQNKGVPVFDYDLTCEVIRGLEEYNIESILSSVSEKHNALAKEIAGMECVMKIKAAGYFLCLPGWSEIEPEDSYESDQGSRIFRTAPCSCGSGRKYKDCCIRIEQYADNAF